MNNNAAGISMLSADEGCSVQPRVELDLGPGTHPPPIGAGGTAGAEPTDTAADTASPRTTRAVAAARHPRRRGDPRRCHCRTPESRKRRRRVQASVSPLLISGGVGSTRRHFRAGWNRGPAQNAQPVCGRRAQIGLTSCSTAPTEPRFSDAEIPKPVECDHRRRRHTWRP